MISHNIAKAIADDWEAAHQRWASWGSVIVQLEGINLSTLHMCCADREEWEETLTDLQDLLEIARAHLESLR